MNIEEKLANMSGKIDKYYAEYVRNHKEDVKRTRKNQYANLSFISLGFAAAATSLATGNPTPIGRLITAILAAALLITGIVLLRKSRSFDSD